MEDILLIPVFAGLAAFGYMNNNNRVSTENNTDINDPSMSNIYNSKYMDNVHNQEKH